MMPLNTCDYIPEKLKVHPKSGMFVEKTVAVIQRGSFFKVIP